jgi:hypothetical protein
LGASYPILAEIVRWLCAMEEIRDNACVRIRSRACLHDLSHNYRNNQGADRIVEVTELTNRDRAGAGVYQRAATALEKLESAESE